MRFNKKPHLILGLLLIAASISIIPSTNAANPDDGYPEGQAAPGRTCPNNDEGFKKVSAFSGKTLVCTLINGVKKWWIEGDLTGVLRGMKKKTCSVTCRSFSLHSNDSELQS